MSEFDCIIQIETVKNVQTIKGGERMLLEERLDEIVKIVNERGSISNQELVKMFGASESTIRRDITTLANDNRVIRVHGGAMSVVSVSYTHLDVYKRQHNDRWVISVTHNHILHLLDTVST